MTPNAAAQVTTLAFDIFGTVLDLSGGVIPALKKYRRDKRLQIEPEAFWAQWRARQRVEQFQDTILMLGHSEYLETARRALIYTLRFHQAPHTAAEVERLMRVFENLNPFPDAVAGIFRLAERYRIVALSNGNDWLVEQLVREKIPAPFDVVISVDRFGCFKPHPAVYRGAAQILEVEPQQIMMVAAHSFDILGARACGFRGAYIDRYRLPYEVSSLQPDITASDILELASFLLGEEPRRTAAAEA